jgi:hypothetical protein
MDILEWMYQEKHPNLYDFETCMSIILSKNEKNSEDVDNQDETHETRDEIDDETYVQASIWINVALQLWDTEPSLVMPHAWFVISQHNEEMESDDATAETEMTTTEETEQPSEEQPDEGEKSKEPLNNKSQE